MEAAAKFNSPVMIQASNGGAQFVAGKSIKDKNACAVGAVALAMHVRAMAPFYGIPVIMHSDHCAKKLLPWFDGMLAADEEYFKQYGEPLFSSHMLDLSEEPDEENIAICVEYFKKMGEFRIVSEIVVRRKSRVGAPFGGAMNGAAAIPSDLTIISLLYFTLTYHVLILHISLQLR